MLDFIDRELVAYAIIGVVALVALPLTYRRWERQSREKLRRRGIKRYGH